jgi:signal transduction histidine kinase
VTAGRPTPVGMADVALAAAVTVLMVIGTGVSLEGDFGFWLFGHGEPWLSSAEGLAVVVLSSLPLAFRRVWPLTVFGISAAAEMAYLALGFRPLPLPLAVLVAFYTVTVVRRPVIALVAAVAYLLLFVVAAAFGWFRESDDQYYTDLVSISATGMLGYGVALGRARATLAEQRNVAPAREHAARMRSAVEQEQARIAREMHDIVAHDVSVMVAQAATARRVFDAQPGIAVEALASIESIGRDALDGLRRLVGLLRTQTRENDRSPQPGLDRLPGLLTHVRRAGLPVELVVLGTRRPLPATVELNAYRIVQEALTNALKHSGREGATVTLDYWEDALRVEVRDLGRPPGDDRVPATTPGYGLIGMQQRIAMLGGELEAGPGPDHGFRVWVKLPVTGGPA